MALPKGTEYGLLLCGFIYPPDFELFSFVDEYLSTKYGSVFLTSPEWNFSFFTDYYAREMGSDLRRRFVIFDTRIVPYELVDIKLFTIDIEQKLSVNGARQVNIDPGFISHNKLILATAKNHYHRVYLDKGIYVELTMAYYHNAWHSLDWTYPDFGKVYTVWFDSIRPRLLERLVNQG